MSNKHNDCNSHNCSSCGLSDMKPTIQKMGNSELQAKYKIALAGNPNTGKSTVFNTLTGLKQHTGNWPGKTVGKAAGSFKYEEDIYQIVDLPGTYSLLSTSEDEEIARNFILFGGTDITVIVADATRLERNMNLILQVLQITDKAVLCVNLLDEARRNHIDIDLNALARRLGIPVVGASARAGKGIKELLETIRKVVTGEIVCKPYRREVLPQQTQAEVNLLAESIKSYYPDATNTQWLAFRLIERDASVISKYDNRELHQMAEEIHLRIGDDFHDFLMEGIYSDAARICQEVVTQPHSNGKIAFDVKLDKILTSRRWGIPIMILLLAIVFWITIIGSNYPSDWLNSLFVGWLYPLLRDFANNTIGMPWWLSGFLVDGVYLATAWVVSVMLPPMAIFFPLLTLLEDFGYLPRVAFNLDELFRRSGAHGKQALTMSMGFGCNAAGVVSARIIDSTRERLLAIITNNFSLCNGRWPTQILIATIFIGEAVPKPFSSIVAFAAVLGVAMLGVSMSFWSSKLLSRTVLKGQVSTFSLELPPYRPPQFWRTLYTSLIDRTLIVLWRAIVFAAPAGALIWLTCNIQIGNASIAAHLIDILNGPAWIFGLNGIILLAYILAIPANEIVLPTILMLTMLTTAAVGGDGAGVLFEAASDQETKALLLQGGWTMLTAVNMMLFCLLHHPCSTTIYTIYKETGSAKWTTVATLLPLAIGLAITAAVAFLWRIFV